MDNFLSSNHNVTKIVFACYVTPLTGKSVHNNRPSHGIAFNCGVQKTYTFSDGKVVTVNKNDFIYLPQNSSYVVNTKSSGEVYCINFLIDQNQDFQPFSLHLNNPTEAIQAFQNAVKVWERKKDGYHFLCKSELYKILAILQSNYLSPYIPNTKQAMLEPAISYIHQHYTEQLISIEYLSQLCGCSYEYFRRLFNLCYGCSPVKYINQLKLKRVKELLSSGFYTVTQAANLSGFFDISYFSRFFKKHVGLSPNDYLTKTN